MTDPQTIPIGEAKGRPMLQWVGKRPLSYVTAFPAQLIERFDPAGTLPSPPGRAPQPGGFARAGGEGLLFHGDNKDVLAWLLAHGYRGQVNLVYIDPPFDSGADYVRRVQLRGLSGAARLEGEAYTLGEQIQYTDIWANDTYLQFMYERMLLLKELLTANGFIFLQCDHRKNHHLRCLMDEVFGSDNFRNAIASRRGTTSVQAQFDTLDSLIPGFYTTLLYSKSADAKLPILRLPRRSIQPGKWDTLWRNHDRPSMRFELLGVTPDTGQWRWSEARARKAVANYVYYQASHIETTELDDFLLNHFEATGEMLDLIRLSDDGTVQCYIPPQAERLANDVWMDFPHMGSVTDYPTEKSEAMLARVIEWASNPGDLVLDCFAGSGTTAAVAQKLGRRWIASDINKGAIQTTSKRLQAVIRDQFTNSQSTNLQATLPTLDDPDAPPPPASLSFALYRVNDYDLTIQHNEAVELAVEHVGIQRLKTDVFFDGTLGQELVKIIPFNHPLSLLDVQLVADELNARPSEARDVALVCLGKETAVDAWLAEYNKRRPVNKLRAIELRTDQKYGRFLLHQPARAQVKITRVTREKSEVSETSDFLAVEIEDFISPTIVERLQIDSPLLKVRIPDWRSMVDAVLIDAAYDGQVFAIALSDAPARKDDLVLGRYELPAPAGPTTVAVKIVDMLGEEVLATATV